LRKVIIRVQLQRIEGCCSEGRGAREEIAGAVPGEEAAHLNFCCGYVEFEQWCSIWW
jgi:hypothetical protein